MNRIIPPQPWLEGYRTIRRQVCENHAQEWKHAGLWRRLVIWMKIEREVDKELKRKRPPGAFYIRHFSK